MSERKSRLWPRARRHVADCCLAPLSQAPRGASHLLGGANFSSITYIPVPGSAPLRRLGRSWSSDGDALHLASIEFGDALFAPRRSNSICAARRARNSAAASEAWVVALRLFIGADDAKPGSAGCLLQIEHRHQSCAQDTETERKDCSRHHFLFLRVRAGPTKPAPSGDFEHFPTH